jgi:hypothetical protein
MMTGMRYVGLNLHCAIKPGGPAVVEWGKWKHVFEMPALTRITFYGKRYVDRGVVLRAWPFYVGVHVPNGWALLRTGPAPARVPTRVQRRLIYAIYECLDGVLPDGVIEDIVTQMLKCSRLTDTEYECVQ